MQGPPGRPGRAAGCPGRRPLRLGVLDLVLEPAGSDAKEKVEEAANLICEKNTDLNQVLMIS